ncbi:MAG: hypothetical protein ABH803_04390 [Candidatus Micrarchaeota archaeon]
MKKSFDYASWLFIVFWTLALVFFYYLNYFSNEKYVSVLTSLLGRLIG